MEYGYFNNPDNPVCSACGDPNEGQCAYSECAFCGLYVCEECDIDYKTDVGALCPRCAKRGKHF